MTRRTLSMLTGLALMLVSGVAVATSADAAAAQAEQRAAAGPPCRRCPGRGGGARAGAASYTGLLLQATGGGEARFAGGDQADGCAGCVWVKVPTCRDNRAYMEGGVIYIVDALCGGAVCAEGVGDQWWLYLHKPGWENLVRVAEICVTPGRPLVTGEQLAAAVEAAFNEKHVPEPKLQVQPRRDVVVVHKPVIGWVGNHTTIDEPNFTQAFGINLALRAYPEYVWNFDVGGDAPGAKRPPTREPGAPYPSFDVSYTYRRTARYRIQVEARWHGEFQIPGITDWIRIDGTPTTTSAPYDVRVEEARAVLYDG